MNTKNKESTEEYLKLFNACSIGVGDTVKVVRGWKNGDYGYACPFNIENGNELLKLRYIVKSKGDDYYYLESGCDSLAVPFFALELVEKDKTNSPTTSDYYRTFHNASGLKVGDSVGVVRKAEDYEMGWNCNWVKEMNKYIGKVSTITKDMEGEGWELDGTGYFPTFVLQKVDSTPTPQPAPATEEIVIKNDSAVVNGKALTKEEIGKLYYRVVRRGKKKNAIKTPKVHNPRNLTPKQYGEDEGYRLLDKDEIKKRRTWYIQIEALCGGGWLNEGFIGDFRAMTYSTKLSREELAKLQ